MGNKPEKVTSNDFNIKEWEQVVDQENSQSQNKGNFRVLENTRTGELIDEYEMFWQNQEDFRFYVDSYFWRRQEYNIVPSRYIVEQHADQFCSRSYAAKIYIEHIPTRLSDVKDIPFPDNLYVVLSVLQGYQKLYQIVHNYFPIFEDQICVDKEGIVKVWVNSDLSKNYPEPDQPTNEHKDQAHMVDELIDLICQNTDEQTQPQSFRQFFTNKKGKRRIGFDEAKVIVNEYAKSVSCQIPERFEAVLQMIQQYDDFEQTQNDHEYIEQEDHQMQNLQKNNHYRQLDQQQREHFNMHLNQPHENDANFDSQHVVQAASQQSNVVNYNHHLVNEPVNYQNVVNTQFVPMPSPQIINPPFIPINYTPVTGPIIRIPPIRGRFTSIVNPMISQQVNTAQIYQNRMMPGQIIENRPNNNIVGAMPFNAQRRVEQENLRMQTFTENRPFQHHLSHINHPQHTELQREQFQKSRNSRQSKTQNLSRPEESYPVGRSLQIVNHTQDRFYDNQNYRANKSQIQHFAAGGNAFQVNYPKAFDERPFSRHSGGNSKLGEVQYTNDRNVQELGDNREQYVDTKYYTLDTEVELDEEIAADLKKMIAAL